MREDYSKVEHTVTVEDALLQEGSGNPFFQVDPGMVIWTWINFLILLVVLFKYAWKPILKRLDEREETIQKSIDDSQKAKSILENVSREREETLSQAQKQASIMISETQAQVTLMREDAEKKIREEMTSLREKTIQEIENEKTRALLEIKKEVISMVVYATSKVLKEKMDEKKDSELIERSIVDFESRKK